MAKYMVQFKNVDAIEVDNVDLISVRNETYFLVNTDDNMNETVEFSVPREHVLYIKRQH